ncbi:MAG: hypothetical protein R3E97_18420 [Candidatus Eisenbacteria bacterium]
MNRFPGSPWSAFRRPSKDFTSRSRVLAAACLRLRPTLPFVVLLSLSSASLLAIWSCSDDEPGPTDIEEPGDPPEIAALVLFDDFGEFGTVTSDTAPDPILILEDDPTRISIRALDSEGETIAAAALDGLEFVTTDLDEDVLFAQADTVDGTPGVYCVGLVPATTAFRLEIRNESVTTFRSAPIATEVHSGVSDVRVVGPTEEPLSVDTPLTFYAGDEFGPLELRYTDTAGTPMPPQDIARFAYVQLLSTSEAIATTGPEVGGDLTFQLHAADRGDAVLVSRLVHRRTGALLWEESLLDVTVKRAWRVFEDGPNGRVRDLAATVDGLVVAGEFTSVGGFAANGVALWTGEAWAPMGSVPGGVSSLAYDGDRLVASTFLGQVVEWNGADWVAIRDIEPGRTVSLWKGAVLTVGDAEEFWTSPGGSCWRLGGIRVIGDRLFAISTCTSTFPIGTSHSAALQERVGNHWRTVDVMGGEPQGLWDGVIWFVEGCGESAYYSAGVVGVVTASHVYRVGEGDPEPISSSVGAIHMTCLDGDFYLESLDRHVYHSANGIDTDIGAIEAGSSYINAMASYGGVVYIAGRITSIDGLRTSNFASWKP